ncbi:ABC transporter ATP-binding protein [Clostridium sp. YIM B02515]|uniref:ABC transporter ATP-binding protein n=1 Tax=Clostridium rhizosphaerae TaxID=2803861 RepID=A0ABS1T9E2_9CLOT|nr:ABC transporter ATP-binding protein [Clostridium rhizosphaerae]MBL4935876.1 ABC transporter ATP-binding protein [Clostridium rhizosphaerae]
MEKNTPVLSLKNISVIFKKRKGLFSKPIEAGAVVNVSLDIDPGEVVAIVGESGCGKTTMGRVISGLLKPTEGQIFFNGIDISKMNKKQYEEFRNGVQIVQQDSYAALNPSRTIYQSLADPLINKKIAKNHAEAKKKIFELLKLVEINPPEQFIEKYPHQLSGGQRQRILMARAISLSPKLIVADEPISMIDVSLRIAILNLMANLNKKFGIAFAYITHDLATARYIAQNGKIVVMYLGKLVEMGDVNKVIEEPKHPYLQALLSAVPIPDPAIARQEKKLPLKSLDMPSITNPPTGCRFNPRCIYATELCEKDEPILKQCGEEIVACHNVDSIPIWKLPRKSNK